MYVTYKTKAMHNTDCVFWKNILRYVEYYIALFYDISIKGRDARCAFRIFEAYFSDCLIFPVQDTLHRMSRLSWKRSSVS